MKVKILSLNCENLADVVPRDALGPFAPRFEERSRLLAAIIDHVDPDIIGMVEAAPSAERTQRWIDEFVDGRYVIHQGESRGLLGLALAIRRDLALTAAVRSKTDCLRLYKLDAFDADNDGIRETYSWANRVPHEVVLSGDGVAPVIVIVIHAKSKGVFIPGDFDAFQRQSRATRMKLRAQGRAVRARLDQLVDTEGRGRVIAMGDMNDSAEFDIFSAQLGGAFLLPIMGSVWEPKRVFHNPHWSTDTKLRWTIDYKDRIVNPLTEARYGTPTDMRSWIDHILVSPELRDRVLPDSAGILHDQPPLPGASRPPRGLRGTDHHPPYVTIEL
jgi:exonuclease III